MEPERKGSKSGVSANRSVLLLDGADRDQDAEEVGDEVGFEIEPGADLVRGRGLVERADDAELECRGDARVGPARGAERGDAREDVGAGGEGFHGWWRFDLST